MQAHHRITLIPRRVWLGAAAIAFAAVVGFLTCYTSEQPDALTAAARAGDLVWHAGEQRGYRLEIDSDVVLDLGSRAQPVRYALHALLCLRVLDVAEGEARVAFQLRDVSWRFGGQADAQHRAALGVPFLVNFRGGMPVQFRFPAGLDGEIQEQLAEVVRTFQATVPTEPAARWSALEEHGSGQYRAVYAAEDRLWQKHKAAYLRGATVRDAGAVRGEASVRVLHSSGLLQPASDASWWDRAEARDELELSNDGNVVARVATCATLVAVPGAFDATSDLARVTRAERLLEQPVPVLDPRQEASPPLTQPAGPQDLARCRELIASFTEDQGRDLAFVHRLAAMLRQFPELAAELPPVLADAALHGSVAAGLAHALELAGNAECQEALGVVCAGVAYPESNRLRAIIALSGVADPAADSVQLLWLLRESTGDAAAQDLGNTALLALGRMGHTLAASDAARYGELASSLTRSLESNPDPDARAVALKALANTRDKALAPVVELHLDAPQPAVRAAAAQALAAMDREDSLGSMTDRLAREPDGRVRAALVEGMRAMSHRSDQAFAACAAMLSREGDPDARNALARYLLDNLRRYPQAREPLQRLLQTESQPGIVAYVAGRLYRSPRQ